MNQRLGAPDEQLTRSGPEAHLFGSAWPKRCPARDSPAARPPSTPGVASPIPPQISTSAYGHGVVDMNRNFLQLCAMNFHQVPVDGFQVGSTGVAHIPA